MKPRTALVVCCLGLLLSVAVRSSAAQARIVSGRSIAGVALGDSVAHVRHVLGSPRSRAHLPHAIGWSYDRGPVDYVLFNGSGHVVAVDTHDPHQRTARGIHADRTGRSSTLGQLRRAYHNIRCQVSKGNRLYFVCVLTTHRRGRSAITVFWNDGAGLGVQGIAVSRSPEPR